MHGFLDVKREEKHSAGDSSSHPPSEDCTVHSITLLPDGRLPQRLDNVVHLPGRTVSPAALCRSYTEPAGLAARAAPIRRGVAAGTSHGEENWQSSSTLRSAGKGSRHCDHDNREEIRTAVHTCKQPPAEDCTVHENTIFQDGRLPQMPGNLVPAPSGNLVSPPGLPSSARESGLPRWEKEKRSTVQ